jgi:hypothetical protein
MPRGKQAFKRGDVTRAVKGAVNAGLDVQGVEVDADAGNIRVTVKKPDPPTAEKPVNEWDAVR